MKAFKLYYFFLGVAIGFFPLAAHAKLGVQNNILGKFFVSNIKGKVTCIVNSRIYELKKGDTLPARGAIVDTGKGANATFLFSNGTGVYVDEKTHFEVKRFEQEFFAPNNNLRVEPSNSLTLVSLTIGRVVLSTPQLLSGTIMIYETPHASVNIRGEKLLIEVNDKQTQTHVAMISGVASVVPRGSDGNFLSIGKRVTTGREAYVTYAVSGSGSGQAGISDTDPSKKPAIQSVAEAQAGNASGNGYLGPKTSAPAPTGPSKTTESAAKVLSVIGTVSVELPGAAGTITPKEGDLLPKGSIVKTEAASELYFAPYKGVIATLRPVSQMEIEKISLTTAQGVLKKQTAIVKLKDGTLVSMIDPTFRDVTDYGVRTPKGIAHANGTAFSITVQGSQFSITTTADTVTLTAADGQTFAIKAGTVVTTAADGAIQPPVSLSQAVVSNPSLTPLLQNAVATVTQVVQNNVGGLSNDAALNLLTKVIATASAALPSQTVAFTNQALTAVSAPSSSTAGNVPAAVSAVLLTTTGTTPSQAVEIATAAAQTLPAQAAVIAAAVAKSAPASAAQSAAAIVKAVTPTSSAGPSQASVQQATAIAAAATSSVPNQAAPVAAAVLQALNGASPQASPEVNATTASTIAAGVTSAAPSQAVSVASILMKNIVQTTPDAQAGTIASSAALLAGAITSVVPTQSQEVATAVMQGLNNNLPAGNSASGLANQAAGLVVATVNKAAPGNEQGVTQAVANVIGSTADNVAQGAQQASGQAGQIVSQAQSSGQSGQQASATGSQAGQTVAQSDAQISTPGWAAGTGLAGNGNGGGSGNSGSGGSSTTTAGGGNGGQTGGGSSGSGSSGNSGSGVAGTGSSGGNSSGGNGGSSGSSSGSTAALLGDDSSGGGAGSGAGGGGSGGSGGAGGGSTGTGAGGAGAGDGSEKATSIIVIQFDPSLFDDVLAPLAVAQGSNTWIPTETGAGSPPDINPIPTTPSQLPPDTTASTAVITGG